MNTNNFDPRCGSDIFSVSYVDVSQGVYAGDFSNMRVDENAIKQMDNAIYIIKLTDDTYNAFHKSAVSNIHALRELVKQSPVVIKFLNNNPMYKPKDLIELAVDAGVVELAKDLLQKANAQSPLNTMFRFEAVLNKNQQVYPNKLN